MKINKDNIETTSRDVLKDKVANLKRLQDARRARQAEHQRVLEQKRQASQEKPDILAKYSDLINTGTSVSDSVRDSVNGSVSNSVSISLSDIVSASHLESQLTSTSLAELGSAHSSESASEIPVLSETGEPEKPLTAVEKLKARLANKHQLPIDDVEPGAVALKPVVDQTTQPIAPVVEQTTQPIEPVVEQTTQPIEPVVEQTTQPIEPVVEQTTQPIEPVVEQITQSIEPVVEQTTQPIEPVTQDTTPLNITNKLSDTQYNAPAIMIPDEPDNSDNSTDSSESAIKWYKRKPVIISGVVGLIAVAILGAFVASRTTDSHKVNNKPSTSLSTSKSSSSSSKSLSYEDALKEKLDKEASQSKTEHNVNVTNIGGGYLLGTVTYYPNDASKSYIDYSLTKPQHPTEVTKDDTVTKIEDELKSKLPTINDTIKVKDKDKLTMETYKLEDGTYSTILLYDKKPFAYVTSDSDLNMVNHVTTYYVSDVAAS